MLAALNHPHVAAIHGVIEADGVRGLVLELVEGATLAERLTEGPLPLTEALNVALQIADALDATHEKGIVHRDLKPANIKITPDGVVKVLDFGVAKVRQIEVSFPRSHEPPTATAGQTGDEVIVGTAAYMSPEQARGKPVDKRSDIWAFGCVLYEMLSGRRAFDGETATDVLAAIIDREPEWNALPSTVPSSVRRLLERCLEKDPKRRLRDIGDARVELEQSRGQARGAGRSSPESRRRPFARPAGGRPSGPRCWSLRSCFWRCHPSVRVSRAVDRSRPWCRLPVIRASRRCRRSLPMAPRSRFDGTATRKTTSTSTTSSSVRATRIA